MTAIATEPGARVWGRELSPEQLVWLTAGATLLFKMLLAVLVPLTKDEGYFVMWGATPSLGYSEHPPMIGLVEHLLLYLGRNELIVRMPAILGTVTVGLGLFWLLKDLDRNRA